MTRLILLLTLASAPARAAGWVTAYYPGWRQARLPPERIDYEAVNVVAHFALVPRPDGTLDAAANRLTPANVAAAVKAAHAAGRRIVVTVGGQASRAGFAPSIAAPRRAAFVKAIDDFARENGYDGVDLDMEEIAPGDAADYAAFVRELRARLDRRSPRPLLTAAVRWEPALFARLERQFDQINIMTYNLSGAYPGWVVWHNGPLYGGERRFLPSVDGLASAFLAAGVPARKLGVGVSFNGSVWTGGEADAPGRSWSSPPQVRSAPYYALAETYGIKEGDWADPRYRWDARAEAAYLSIPGTGGADAQFVSYANAASISRLAGYVRKKGLGGLIVWDLGAGWIPGRADGARDPLLQAVKKTRLAAEGVP